MKPPLFWGARRNEGRELSLGSSSSGLVGGLANDTWITVTSNDPFFNIYFYYLLPTELVINIMILIHYFIYTLWL